MNTNMDIVLSRYSEEEIFAAETLAGLWRAGAAAEAGAGDNAQMSNQDNQGSSRNYKIEDSTGNSSNGSSSSVEVQPENAEVPQDEPNSHKNCSADEVPCRQQAPDEPVYQDDSTGLREFKEVMLPIGVQKTMVPERILKTMDYSSYTKVTRKLLHTIFKRKTLATHSLTGRLSPAYLDRPPKKLLDPSIVEDVIIFVTVRCHVAENLVRMAITRKCTDEAKLYQKRRLQWRSARPEKDIGSSEDDQPQTVLKVEEKQLF